MALPPESDNTLDDAAHSVLDRGTLDDAALKDDARLQALARTHLSATADETLDRFTGLVRRMLDVPVALVSLVEPDRQIFPGQSGLRGRWAEERQTPLSHSFCQYVVQTGEPLIVADARADEVLCSNLAIRDLGVVAYLGVPLTDEAGNVLGSLCAIDDQPRQWTDRDVDNLRDLQSAVAAELRLRILVDRLSSAQSESDASLRLAQSAQSDAELSRDRAETANQRLLLLSEVGEALTSSLDPEVAVGRLAPLLVPLLGDWCVISLLDEDGGRRDIGRAHRDAALLPLVGTFASHHQVVTEHAPSAIALRTGAPVITPAIGPDLIEAAFPTAEARAAFAALAPAALASFPLRARGRSLGVLSIVNGSRRGRHTNDELNAAAEVARRAGMALDNARLFAQQRRVAETLQRSLLTPPPRAAGLRIAVDYRPAAVDAQVGGDWYDAFCQADGSTVLVIGDVVGHDIAATADMGQLRSLVRGIAFDREDGPAGVLSRVDRAISVLTPGTLATAVLARVDCGSDGPRTVQWSSAGHPPPLLLEPDGSVRLLDDVTDVMLGVDAAMPRRESKAVLSPGATLLLCTDGVFERRDQDIDDALADLAATMSELAPLASGNLEDFCRQLLDRQVGPHSDDDAALVVVHVPARAEPSSG